MAYFNGTDGNDSIIVGGNDDDFLFGNDGNDFLESGNGNNWLNGGNGVDFLYGKNGNDALYGGDGIDYLYGGEGNDVLWYDPADAVVSGGNGIDILDAGGIVGPVSIDLGLDKFWDIENVWGWNFPDTLLGNSLDNELHGSGGNDSISGDAGDDWLSGDDGNDVLTGDSGNDYLNGGNGSDTLFGGIGNDTYQFGTNYIYNADLSGNDIILIDAANGNDTIEARNMDMPDFAEMLGNDLVLYYWSANDDKDYSITLQGWGLGGGYSLRQYHQFYSADATGSSENSWYVLDAGTNGNNSANNAGNNNMLLYFGLDGNDTYHGGEAKDRVWGGNGEDRIYGGNGADWLKGQAGNDFLYGEAGNDVIFGGVGNDWFSGGSGSDVYRFGNSDPTVAQDDLGHDTIAGSADNEQDVIQLRNIKGLQGAEKVGNDLRLNFINQDQGGIANSITLQNWFVGAGYQIRSLSYLLGNTTTSLTLQAGSDANDVFNYGNTSTVLYFGLGGNDTIFATVGGNSVGWLFGDAGNDRLEGGTGNDYLEGGSGNDTITGGSGADQLLGGDGNDWLGYDEADLFYSGGAGIDALNAFASDGAVRIDLNDYPDIEEVVASQGNSTLIGNALDNMLFGLGGADWLSGGAGNDGMAGRDGDDTLYGGEGNDWLDGEAGADQLFGGAGNDTLIGGVGADSIYGDDGNDLFVIGNYSQAELESFWERYLRLTVPTEPHRFNIELDYRYDTTGFWTAERRAAAEYAANTWESLLTDDFATTPAGTQVTLLWDDPDAAGYQCIEQTITLDHDVDDMIIFMRGNSYPGAASFKLVDNTQYVHERYTGNDAYQPIASAIDFNINGSWWIDPTPLDNSDDAAHLISATDFITVLQHEMGHSLGLVDRWMRSYMGGSINSVLEHVVTIGGNDYFNGANAVAEYGGLVPLDAVGHVVTADYLSVMLSQPEVASPGPSALDAAILKDIGYQISI